MSRPHPEHPAAGAELFAAAERYEQIEPGLGHAFFTYVAEAVDAIERFPEGWPPFPGWTCSPVVRTKGMTRFPYRVVHFVDERGPVILAYAHERQQPGHWARRYDDMLGA